MTAAGADRVLADPLTEGYAAVIPLKRSLGRPVLTPRKALIVLGGVALAAVLIAYSSLPMSVTPATGSVGGVRAMLTAAVADIHEEHFDALCRRYIAPESQLELKRLGGCAALFAANWTRNRNRHHGIDSRLSAIYLARIAVSGRRATFYSTDGNPEEVGARYVGGHWRLEIAGLLAHERDPHVPQRKGRLV